MNKRRMQRVARVLEMKKKITEEIFREIDAIIQNNIKENPIPFDKSNFRREYEKLKRKYLGG